MKFSRRISALGGLAAAVLLGGWAYAAEAPDAVSPELVKAARAEGKVVIYSTSRRAIIQKLSAVFEKKYGVKVDQTRKPTSGVTRVVEAERMAGTQRWDVAGSGDEGVVRRWVREGVLERYNPANARFLPKKLVKLDGYVNYMYFNLYVIAYNKKKIPPDQAPKTWKDVLHPRWKGRMAIAGARTSAGTRTFIDGILEKYGWDFVNKLSDNRPLMSRSVAALRTLLQRGEVDMILAVPDRDILAQIAKGAPLAVVYPSEFIPITGSSRGVGKKAPHPNAGCLWLEFLVSYDAQKTFASLGYYILRPDVPTLPQFKRPPAETLNFRRPDWEAFAKTRDQVIRKFDKIMRTTRAGR